MKKVLACLLALAILASLGITAFAAEVPSVQPDKPVPVVVPTTPDKDEEDVSAWIIITDYEDKEKLPKAAEEQLDQAYEALQDVAAVVDGNEDLKALLEGKEVDCESLFDISIVEDKVELPVEVKLELVNPDHFAALLHFVDGEATLIETELKDENLVLTLEETGAYAVLSFVEAE